MDRNETFLFLVKGVTVNLDTTKCCDAFNAVFKNGENELVHTHVIRVLCRFQQLFDHITTVAGNDRNFSAHFYSTASMRCKVPHSWHDTTPVKLY